MPAPIIRWTLSLLALLACLSTQVLHAGSQKVAAEVMAGKSIYQQHCVKCHGMAGWGDGPLAETLRVAPRNFHDSVTDLKPDEHLRMSVAYGVMATPMHAWRGILSDQQIEDVVAYVRLLSNAAR